MKKIEIILLVLLSLPYYVLSQTKINPAGFNGAPATLKNYKVVYFIDDSDINKIKGIIININNALADPRLQGKLEVELVAFGQGVAIYKKSNHYDTSLLQLQNKGVLLAECLNTIRILKISKDELWPFISYVPSGNGEIIIRQSEGWSVVHP